MKTIIVEKDGERFKINEPNQDVLEGKRKPETEQEREDAEVARGLKERGFSPVKPDAEEKPAKGGKGRTPKEEKKAAEPEASTGPSTEEGK
jgi:hypothetical protein